MKHYLNYVSIPIDKGTINLKQRPRALPFLSSSRNEQAYINYYQSFIEATIRIVVQGNADTKQFFHLLLKKPDLKKEIMGIFIDELYQKFRKEMDEE